MYTRFFRSTSLRCVCFRPKVDSLIFLQGMAGPGLLQAKVCAIEFDVLNHFFVNGIHGLRLSTTRGLSGHVHVCLLRSSGSPDFSAVSLLQLQVSCSADNRVYDEAYDTASTSQFHFGATTDDHFDAT